MRLRLPAEVPPGTIVDFQLDDGTNLHGIVRYCRELGDVEYNVGVEVAGAKRVLERRKEARFGCKGSAILLVSNHAGVRVRHAATICDVSQSGLGFYSSEPVATGIVVDLSFRDLRVSGIVRNCMPGPGGFRIGMNVTNVHKSDPAAVTSSRTGWFTGTGEAINHWVAKIVEREREWKTALLKRLAHS